VVKHLFFSLSACVRLPKSGEGSGTAIASARRRAVGASGEGPPRPAETHARLPSS
jgi:hypothetical protein